MSKVNIRLLLISLLCYGFSVPALSLDNTDTQRLLEQGHYWYGRGQFNLAASSWKKVLSMDPDNKEAQEALREISIVKDETRVNQQKLQLARQLASERRYEESLHVYEDAFNGTPPTSALAAEYYETLAGTENGWSVAIEKFKSLVKSFPSNPRYALTLAKLKTYRDVTRREGIAALMALAQTREVYDKDIHSEALSAVHDALTWLDVNEEDKPIYQSYMAVVPEDDEIRKKLLHLVHGDTLKDAYALLNDGKLDDAAQEFNRILEMEPKEADSLAGLGFVRLKQKEFEQAETLFSQAIEADPTKGKQLQSALTTATYWSLLSQARYAREEKNLEYAKELAMRAQELNTGEMEGQMLLASLATEQGDTSSAIQIYGEIIKQQPANRHAVESLINLLLTTGDEDEAFRVASKHHFSQIEFKHLRNRLNTDKLRAQANKALMEGSFTKAFLLLQEARSLNPENAWLSFDLSKLYLQQGQVDKAYALFDELLSRRPNDVDALYAKAMFCGEAKDWLLGLNTLERIPQAMRSKDHQALQRTLWSSYQKHRIGKLLEQGDLYNAERVAESVKKQSEDDPRMLMTYAEILYDLHKTEEAFVAMRKALAMGQESDTALRIQYAGFLLKLNKDAELDLVLKELDSASLSPNLRNEVDRIRMGLAIRRAYERRDDGDVAGAYKQLLPWLQSRPNDPDILQVAALLYADVSEHKRALALFKKLLAFQSGNINAREGAVNSAIALKDFKTAQSIIKAGLVADPESPRLYVMRGRVYQAQGDSKKAAEDFRDAIKKYQAWRAVRVTDTYIEGAYNGPRLVFAEGYGTLSDAGFPFEPLIDTKIDATETKLTEAIEEPDWIQSARKELSQLESRNDKTMQPGLTVRNRSGDRGLDELTEIDSPFRFRAGLDYSSTIGIDITPVFLDAEDVDGGTEQARRFGSLAVDLDAFAKDTFEQNAEGVAVAASYRTTEWAIDIGTTPLGFREESLVGSLEWSPHFNGISPGVTIERRPVTDSLVSYAGTKDPQTGNTWGGVTRTGLILSITQDDTDFGIYGKAAAYTLKGKNVKDNDLVDLNGGAYWKTLSDNGRELTIGVNLTYMKYEDNLRYFTLGHGGYFSPQRYIAIIFPINFKGYRGHLKYNLSADIGMQNHKEDQIALYPTNSILQDQLETVAATDSDIRTSYDGNTDTGAVYNLRAEFDYKIDKRLSLEGLMFSGHANDYNENAAFVSMRYSFNY